MKFQNLPSKVYPKLKSNPWYVVTGVGAKFPRVKLNSAGVDYLSAKQKLFPSYLAEIGFGKNLGKFSAEGGFAVSLYQYKLTNGLNGSQAFASPEELELEVNSFTEENSNSRIVNSGGVNSTINKFAVFSPYLRGQYSFDLKNNFVLGLHGVISMNKKVSLPSQQIEDNQTASSGGEVFELSSAIRNLVNGNLTNFNYEIGASIEKRLANQGRIAIDISYAFASGLLEAGSFGSQDGFTFGTYTINGSGPKIKFRYYLNINS